MAGVGLQADLLHVSDLDAIADEEASATPLDDGRGDLPFDESERAVDISSDNPAGVLSRDGSRMLGLDVLDSDTEDEEEAAAGEDGEPPESRRETGGASDVERMVS